MSLHYGNVLTARSRDVLQRALRHPSVIRRYFSVNTPDELLTFKEEHPDRRIERFTRWGVSLAADAARNAMRSANVPPEAITAIVVNTCTGYICPGLATYLIDELGLHTGIAAHDLVGSGCGGAVPNINLGKCLIAEDSDGIALCISVEICSATFEMENDLSLIVSNAIFGDGAAAAVVGHHCGGFEIVDVKSSFNPRYRDDVRFTYRHGRLHNRISAGLPSIIGTLVPSFIIDFLESNHLSISDIDWWALHPGGAKMLEVIQEKLHLTDEKMKPAQTVYSQFGNMSSPTVLFELDRIASNGVRKGQRCLMTAYGAGLSIHGALLTCMGN